MFSLSVLCLSMIKSPPNTHTHTHTHIHTHTHTTQHCTTQHNTNLPPFHFSRSLPHQPLGGTSAGWRVLRQLGWPVVCVPSHIWHMQVGRPPLSGTQVAAAIAPCCSDCHMLPATVATCCSYCHIQMPLPMCCYCCHMMQLLSHATATAVRYCCLMLLILLLPPHAVY